MTTQRIPIEVECHEPVQEIGGSRSHGAAVELTDAKTRADAAHQEVSATMKSMDLRPALSGERREIDDTRVGRLSWYRAGPADSGTSGTPLLLVHSVNAAASAYEVKPLYEHYGRQRPVYALDLPGFGFSERSDRAYDPRLMTDAIHALLAEIRRECGSGPVDALSLSLSSEFLARAAVEAPGAFRSLALVSPTGFNRAALRTGPEGSTLGRSAPLTVLKFLDARRRVFDLLTRRGTIRYFLRKTWGSERIDEGLFEYDFLTTRPEGSEFAPLRFVSGFLFSGDSGNLYRAIVHPVWAVHGVRGDFVDYPGLSQMNDRPNWTIKVLPTGALPHFEAPQEFFRYYDAWCRSLATRSHVEVATARNRPDAGDTSADAAIAGTIAGA
jgi:pimeloyl-ACP methyl ester carboxylesterase